MKFFMQHIGEVLSQRDFPRTLGNSNKLVYFDTNELLNWPELAENFSANDIKALERENDPFQIWGLPIGARNYTKQMQQGDALMLLGSAKTCEYIGEIFHKLTFSNREVSQRLWGEPKFETIVLLKKSQFIMLDWSKFLDRVGYSPTYELRGATSRVATSKIKSSQFTSAEELAEWVRTHKI
ncbi:hypothetical protein [Thalassorhabdomicrobium marinisediminis]|uniref:hypothetical protein n=1 Tax=Thalassorhabdomicrobium marinisediminis TaxID=2170577 RepID=UPI00248F5799|nr:hypothetical protein [Thalassorhabdomicrobium marinisediminis]